MAVDLAVRLRMNMKRFSRLSNAFPKKLASHRHALSLYFYFYNWCRIHKTLRVSPAMASGLTDKLLTFEALIVAPKPGRPKTYKKRVGTPAYRVPNDSNHSKIEKLERWRAPA